MERLTIRPRDDWKETAERHGFTFHTIDGQPYWDETACYKFTLRQIEDHLEYPASELETMCFEVVERAIADEVVLRRLAIPAAFWDAVSASWRNRERNLYGRMDFAYDGHGPAKLLEYNADTPTSLYETAVFQWVWLEQAMERGLIPPQGDQFNSVHERLVDALGRIGIAGPLHLACARDSGEDRATVAYVEDCARQAGLDARFLHMDEIGLDPMGRFTDTDDLTISTLFKLYPWEWLFEEPFGLSIPTSGCAFIEPAWKAILSNKGLLALLWDMFEGHPNLLPAHFEDDPRAADLPRPWVRKPLLSREGWNVDLVGDDGSSPAPVKDGPYGAEGHVAQAFHPLPEFAGNRPVCGVWLIASQPCGLGIREDTSWVTGNDARFLPHIISE